MFPDSEFSGSYVTDRPVPSSHNIAGSSTTDEGTIAVPSTSIARPSISSSTVDKVSIPDTHIVSEIPMQNPTTIRPLLQLPHALDLLVRRSVWKRKSTIYTDTPENENPMEMKQKQKRKETLKKTKSQRTVHKTEKHRKGQRKRKRKGQIHSKDCRDDDNTIRLECTESYADSIPGEQWFQCITCKLWADYKCIIVNLMFFDVNIVPPTLKIDYLSDLQFPNMSIKLVVSLS
ncbi:hypothetical protein HHI36_017113 [Cryptolaemus montrouzieri]|uniref:Uncharacterized protein n=1 Tax=Cryptolaemus montrouzieri TaxID=559131 RepID=A0ABD2NLM6_9CUCU